MFAVANKHKIRRSQAIRDFVDLAKLQTEKADEKAENFFADHELDATRTDIEGYTILHKCCEKGLSRRLFHFLLKRGADVMAKTINGSTPLLIASERGHVEAVRCLLHETQFDNHMEKGYYGVGSTALLMAIKQNHVETALALIDAGVSVGADDNTGEISHEYGGPIHWAAYNGSLEVIKKLVAREADLNETSKDGVPLFWAAAGKHYRVMEYLLEHGATPNPDAINRQGKSLRDIIGEDKAIELGILLTEKEGKQNNNEDEDDQ